MTKYTLNDHAKAVLDLARLNEKWENYSGNNPNKYRADIEAAKATLARVERALKDTGVLPRTAQEERDAALDKAYLNALTAKSRSGKVKQRSQIHFSQANVASK
ncbi:hypothetical protein BHL63_13415 [Xanthomonas alfalfae]|nr:hypothetical protein BHL63_13415 [Xanthomonas alfalfae]